MILKLIPEKEILELEKELGIELVMNERNHRLGLKKFYVSFPRLESMEGSCLISYSGNGETMDEALKDYAEQLSCRRIVIDAYKSERKEIELPKIVHTRFINQ